MAKTEIIAELITELLPENGSTFLVEVDEHKNNKYVVYLDDDQGLTLDMIVRYSNILRPKLETLTEFADGDFILEVSSASLDRPLKQFRQYQKNLGRKVKIQLLTGEVLQGKLNEVSETELELVKEKKVYKWEFPEIKACYVLPF